MALTGLSLPSSLDSGRAEGAGFQGVGREAQILQMLNHNGIVQVRTPVLNLRKTT